jgi:uncharacterized protein YndB with AHSA1/START domain
MTDLPHRLDRTLVIRAPRAIVFRYFTDRERFARWWGDGSRIDGRVGGEVHIVYPNGVVARGSITRLEPDRLVAFTYGYEDPQKPIRVGGSLVTVTLADHADGTRLELRHDVADAAARDQHVPGWRFQLAMFANVVAVEAHARTEVHVDAWFAAWAEADAARRSALLAGCTTDDVTMQDRWSCLSGRDELHAHIGVCLAYAPGASMRRVGAVRQCQGTAAVEWTATGADGSARGQGTNVLRLAADGRIAGVVGLW